MSWLQKVDAFPKTLDDFRVKTYAGASVTLVSSVLIALLVLSEFSYYRSIEVKPSLIVDSSRGEKLRISFNVTFPRASCTLLSVDVMDVAGEHQSNLEHDIRMQRLDLMGLPINEKIESVPGDRSAEVVEAARVAKSGLEPGYCGDCYGADPPEGSNGCCNTCEDVREAYRRKGWAFTSVSKVDQCVRDGWVEKVKSVGEEGCNVEGTVLVNKVAGNVHVAPGKSFQQEHSHMHDLGLFASKLQGKFDMRHVIHSLSFGVPVEDIKNPLDETAMGLVDSVPNTMYQYFIKVVPTDFVYLDGTTLTTTQFSATMSEHPIQLNHGLPGVFFHYEISPMRVIYTQTHRPFFTFLTGVCAIVGGIFTVAGMIDSFIYSANRTLQKKIQMGKAH